MALKIFSENNLGAISFDFPGHGVSPTYEDDLTITNCLNYLSEMENFVKDNYPNSDIFYFSSSFGAFINTIYLCTRPHQGKKSFFRSGAVNMPELFNDVPIKNQNEIEKNGFTILDEYEPPLKITSTFLKEMKEMDLFSLWKKLGSNALTNIEMVHGEKDETIDVNAAKKFAEISNSKITIIPDGEHRLMNEGEPKTVFNLALNFFNASL